MSAGYLRTVRTGRAFLVATTGSRPGPGAPASPACLLADRLRARGGDPIRRGDGPHAHPAAVALPERPLNVVRVEACERERPVEAGDVPGAEPGPGERGLGELEHEEPEAARGRDEHRAGLHQLRGREGDRARGARGRAGG